MLDLRGSYLAGITIDARVLRGTKVDPAQVADVAKIFGLVVESLDDDQAADSRLDGNL